MSQREVHVQESSGGDRPARPDELRWKITRTIGQDGREFHMVDGPCIRGMTVMPVPDPEDNDA